MNLFNCNFKCIQQREAKQNITISQIRIPNIILEFTPSKRTSLMLSPGLQWKQFKPSANIGNIFLKQVSEVMDIYLRLKSLQVIKDVKRLNHLFQNQVPFPPSTFWTPILKWYSHPKFKSATWKKVFSQKVLTCSLVTSYPETGSSNACSRFIFQYCLSHHTTSH